MKTGLQHLIVTNNPLVKEKLSSEIDVLYMEADYIEILSYVRDRIHMGYELKSHPLSGSVKPGETPYKSVIIGTKQGQLDMQSLEIIESAIVTAKKFVDNTAYYDEAVKRDFQIVDYTLIRSAVDMIIQK